MIHKLLAHLRANVVAYIALFFAIGGGGGYAVAATAVSSKPVHSCVSKRTGALYITSKRCSRIERTFVFNQQGPRGLTGPAGQTGAAGTSAVVAYGEAAGGGAIVERGVTITSIAAGEYTVTAAACSGTPTPVVSPLDDPSATGIPVAWTDPNPGGSADSFIVRAGVDNGGTYQATNQGFSVLVECDQ